MNDKLEFEIYKILQTKESMKFKQIVDLWFTQHIIENCCPSYAHYAKNKVNKVRVEIAIYNCLISLVSNGMVKHKGLTFSVCY